MVRFDYYEWKRNPKREVVTRDGRNAKIVGYDVKSMIYPVLIEVDKKEYQVTLRGLKYSCLFSDDDIFFKDYDKQELKWRKCEAGYKFPSDAIVIPDDERTTDRDPRLVRCAVWDSKYILIEDLKKLPVYE